MNKVVVTARSHDRKTGKPVNPARAEVVNIKENILFHQCKTATDVKRQYESFWNDVNPKSKEVVYVQNVRIVN